MKPKKRKFWVEDIKYIIHDYNQIIPTKKMCIESKMNLITRIILVIFFVILILGLTDLKNSIIFLLFSLLIIIFIYYKQKDIMIDNTQIIENFTPLRNSNIITQSQQPNEIGKTINDKFCNFKPRINYHCKQPDMIKEDKNLGNFYNDTRPNYNNKYYNTNFAKITDNQSLVGRPNPKTLVPPIISAPMADIDYWRNNKNLAPEVINNVKEKYEIESGYKVVGECSVNYKEPRNYYCGYKQKKGDNNNAEEKADIIKRSVLNQNIFKNNSEIPFPIIPPEETKESFEFPYEISSKYNKVEEPGQYFSKNKNNYQNILNEADDLADKPFKNNKYYKNKYSENIFQEATDPSVYKATTYNEPINSLMGITYSEQFHDDDFENNSEIIEPPEYPNNSNTYDPRFYGYGSNDRFYVDKQLGQGRWMYDDVDAVRRPNYITRNSIDVFNFGDAYGSQGVGGNPYHSNINALADKHYLDSSLQFRDEMRERLMRKNNSINQQNKMYPKMTHSQRA